MFKYFKRSNKAGTSYSCKKKAKYKRIKEKLNSIFAYSRINLKSGIEKSVKIIIKGRRVFIKIAPTVYIFLTILLLLEQMRTSNGSIALALERNNKTSQFRRVAPFRGNFGAIRDICWMVSTNNLRLDNVRKLIKNHPVTVTFLVTTSLTIVAYTTYKVYQILSTPEVEDIYGYVIAMDEGWQRRSLEFISNVTQRAIKMGTIENDKSFMKSVLLDTLGHQASFEGPVTRFVEDGITLNAANGLLAKTNNDIWRRAQLILKIETPKYDLVTNIPTTMREFVAANPPSPVSVPKQLQHILGTRLNVPLSVAELKEISKAAHKFADLIPAAYPAPAKLNQIIQIVNFADQFTDGVEKGRLVNVAEIAFMSDNTNSTNLTDLIK